MYSETKNRGDHGDSLSDTSRVAAIEQESCDFSHGRFKFIPKIDMMTLEQVAEFYDESYDSITSRYYRNKEEIDNLGTMLIDVTTLIDLLSNHGGVAVQYGGYYNIYVDGMNFVIPASGEVVLLSKKAVLDMGLHSNNRDTRRAIADYLIDNYGRRILIEHMEGKRTMMRANILDLMDHGSKEDLKEYLQDYIKFLDEYKAILE